MSELWLKFRDQDGAPQRVPVRKDSFAIGRHSNNDLSIPVSNLSREHLRIERFGSIFAATDQGSSNGTTINGGKLTGPVTLKDGDKLDLGGGLKIEVELVSEFSDPYASFHDIPAAAGDEPKSAQEPGAAVPYVASTPALPAGTGAIPKSVFYIAPLLGLVVIVIVGALIYTSAGNKNGRAAGTDPGGFQYSANEDEDEAPSGGDTNSSQNTEPGAVPRPSGNTEQGSLGSNSSPVPGGTTLPADKGGAEQHVAAFMRAIAQNDPKAFLTGEQVGLVSARIKRFEGSGALADNINSARRNAAQIKSLAAAKNLKPQFLAAAALTKLGNQRGDALQAAQGMADVLDKLATQIGNELGEDCVLMMAAYDQGAAGDFLKMRNMLQDLATKSSESSRTIRTIWFLNKAGKITPAEFDMAINFLAIGAIAQNPKDFGVKAEPLNL
jgi:hypothetical protein